MAFKKREAKRGPAVRRMNDVAVGRCLFSILKWAMAFERRIFMEGEGVMLFDEKGSCGKLAGSRFILVSAHCSTVAVSHCCLAALRK